MSEVTYLQGFNGVHFYIFKEVGPRPNSATGYGSKLPTDYMVERGMGPHPQLPDERKRRVYAICHSNVASHYILVKGERLFIGDWQF